MYENSSINSDYKQKNILYEWTMDNVMNSILKGKASKNKKIQNNINLTYDTNNYRNYMNSLSNKNNKKRNEDEDLPNIKLNKYDKNKVTAYNYKENNFRSKKRAFSGISYNKSNKQSNNQEKKQYYIISNNQNNVFNSINNNYFNNRDKNNIFNIFDMYNEFNQRNNIIQNEGKNQYLKRCQSNYYNNKLINSNNLQGSNLRIKENLEENYRLDYINKIEGSNLNINEENNKLNQYNSSKKKNRKY